jgi:hypothetical protein
MKKATILVAAAAAFGACTFAMNREAHALGPIDLEIAAKAGAGTNPTQDSPNPFGFGLGGRAGVDFFSFYAGVQGIYYFGSGETEGVSGFQTATVSRHAWDYGVEVGYNLSVSVLTLRPQIGIGGVSMSSSLSGSGFISGSTSLDHANESSVYIEPGVTALISLGTWFIGADANIFVAPDLTNDQAAFTFHGQIGIKL